VFFQSLGDTFYYVTTEAQRLASLALDSLTDVSMQSWLIIGGLVILTYPLWRRRPRK